MQSEIESALWNDGYAIVPGVLDEQTSRSLIELYDDAAAYRGTIVMARHSYGSGEYRYYRYPLPEAVQRLRVEWYARLAPLANAWNEATRVNERYPLELQTYVDRCHANGQTRPTALILRYGPGDFNCLHQDVYGELGFPFQLTVPLSVRDEDYEGGETVLTEQAPRLQAKPIVVRPQRGDALVFSNRYRPKKGASGTWVRYNVRHGICALTRGQRYALGIIFHDAQ